MRYVLNVTLKDNTKVSGTDFSALVKLLDEKLNIDQYHLAVGKFGMEPTLVASFDSDARYWQVVSIIEEICIECGISHIAVSSEGFDMNIPNPLLSYITEKFDSECFFDEVDLSKN